MRILGIGFVNELVTFAHKKFTNMSGDKLAEVVFVLGGPGAGKGTQCSNIVQEFGYVHLSAGELLREERNRPGSPYGQLIEHNLKIGKIIPVEITCSLIEAAMKRSETKKFLIDGFPRNQDNFDGWAKVMSDRVKLHFVLFFDCTEEVCVERCLKRGAGGSGRSDDNPESLKLRFGIYMNETLPIIQFYEKQDLVKKIDSTRSADEVFEDVKSIFQSI